MMQFDMIRVNAYILWHIVWSFIGNCDLFFDVNDFIVSKGFEYMISKPSSPIQKEPKYIFNQELKISFLNREFYLGFQIKTKE